MYWNALRFLMYCSKLGSHVADEKSVWALALLDVLYDDRQTMSNYMTSVLGDSEKQQEAMDLLAAFFWHLDERWPDFRVRNLLQVFPCEIALAVLGFEGVVASENMLAVAIHDYWESRLELGKPLYLQEVHQFSCLIHRPSLSETWQLLLATLPWWTHPGPPRQQRIQRPVSPRDEWVVHAEFSWEELHVCAQEAHAAQTARVLYGKYNGYVFGYHVKPLLRVSPGGRTPWLRAGWQFVGPYTTPEGPAHLHAPIPSFTASCRLEVYPQLPRPNTLTATFHAITCRLRAIHDPHTLVVWDTSDMWPGSWANRNAYRVAVAVRFWNVM